MNKKSNLLNILNYKLYKYKNKTYLSFVKTTITSLMNFDTDKIEVKYLDSYLSSSFYNETFYISKSGKVIFLHKENMVKFLSLEGKYTVNTLLNISIKNEKTYEVIKTIESLQKDFFLTNDIKTLIYISHEDILSLHKKKYNTYLSKPIISNILNNTYYRNNENKSLCLSYLTPKKNFIFYIKIKIILNHFPYASDKVLKYELKNVFNLNISIVQISQIRKKYFIRKKSERKNPRPYIRFNDYFSSKIFLTKMNIKKLQNVKAIYELRTIEKNEYKYSSSHIVYIGSSKNICKRLTEYLNNSAHTKIMRDFFQKNNLLFRYIETENYVELEKTLLNEFYENNGGLPLLNKNNLRQDSRFDIEYEYIL